MLNWFCFFINILVLFGIPNLHNVIECCYLLPMSLCIQQTTLTREREKGTHFWQGEGGPWTPMLLLAPVALGGWGGGCVPVDTDHTVSVLRKPNLTSSVHSVPKPYKILLALEKGFVFPRACQLSPPTPHPTHTQPCTHPLF